MIYSVFVDSVKLYCFSVNVVNRPQLILNFPACIISSAFQFLPSYANHIIKTSIGDSYSTSLTNIYSDDEKIKLAPIQKVFCVTSEPNIIERQLPH